MRISPLAILDQSWHHGGSVTIGKPSQFMYYVQYSTIPRTVLTRTSSVQSQTSPTIIITEETLILIPLLRFPFVPIQHARFCTSVSPRGHDNSRVYVGKTVNSWIQTTIERILIRSLTKSPLFRAILPAMIVCFWKLRPCRIRPCRNLSNHPWRHPWALIAGCTWWGYDRAIVRGRTLLHHLPGWLWGIERSHRQFRSSGSLLGAYLPRHRVYIWVELQRLLILVSRRTLDGHRPNRWRTPLSLDVPHTWICNCLGLGGSICHMQLRSMATWRKEGACALGIPFALLSVPRKVTRFLAGKTFVCQKDFTADRG